MKTRLVPAEYLGYTAMDKRFSTAMLPWVILEIKRRGTTEKLCLGVESNCLNAYDQNFEVHFNHKLVNIIRFNQVPGNALQFFYVLKDSRNSLLNCYLFQASDEDAVTELLGQMKDHSIGAHAAQYHANVAAQAQMQTNTHVASNRAFRRSSVDVHDTYDRSEKTAHAEGSNDGLSAATSLTSLSADISPSSSHFFEVLYIGKIKVSHRKVPQTLIDDALSKLRQHQADRTAVRRHSLLSSQANSFSSDTSEFTDPALTRIEVVPAERCDADPTEAEITIAADATIRPAARSYENLRSCGRSDASREFDAFSRERWERNDKRPPKNGNLSILEEDEKEHATARGSGGFDDELEKGASFGDGGSTAAASDDARSATVAERSDNSDEGSSNFDAGASQLESLPENRMFHRHRSASIGTLNSSRTPIVQPVGEQNRTMLFQVGRTDIRLISTDRKQIILHKQLKEVASCALGQNSGDHFGFICRESSQENYVGYIFKCESDSVANEVINAVKQAFTAQAEQLKQGRDRSSSSLTCEHCPMLWYHRLCQDIEGLSDKRVHAAILKRLEQLSEEEQEQIMTKYLGGTDDIYEVGEHNSFLMMLLRAHCEAKQQRHMHDTAENRSEFLNLYLGSSTIFMKAKRSLSSSFDHLLKRKASKDDFGLSGHVKKETSPVTPVTPTASEFGSQSEGIFLKPSEVASQASNRSGSLSPHHEIQEASDGLKSPMMDIFMKVSASPRSPQTAVDAIGSPASQLQQSRREGRHSWRQAIFNRALLSPVHKNTKLTDITCSMDVADSSVTTQQLLGLVSPNRAIPVKRDKAELRALWKKAIHQTVLLVRMERENIRLKVRQEESAVKRIKLDYDDLAPCDHETSKFWDLLLVSKDTRISNKVDAQMLMQAVRQGIPRSRRGEVWWILAEQHCMRHPPPDTRDHPLFNVPYRQLLTLLTSQQHAILIDIGRTFPQHAYFSSPLGPGQLALYNLLKAYSLLDPQLGYCQGLSFVAAVLLLHMEEAEAFMMLRHLMFRRGLRKQYLPDMNALQIQLYQMSRLLRDQIPELYDKFDQHDVSPTLYAAPWMLTLFTSQFPLGFVARVFDMAFLESSEVTLRVALALLEAHRDGLMLCESFEEIMEYLKHKMPNIDKNVMDKVIKQVFATDYSKQLNEYQVEYHVLQEEMPLITPKIDALNQHEATIKELKEKNAELMDQLEMAVSTISTYQTSQSKLESQIRSLEQSLAVMARFVASGHKELPADIRRLVQQTEKKKIAAKANNESTESNQPNGKKYVLKTGLSTPNLFSRQPDIISSPAPQSDDEKLTEKKRQFLAMKKSHSFHPDLIADGSDSRARRAFPLRVLEETTEYAKRKSPPAAVSPDHDSGVCTPVSPDPVPSAVFHPLSGLDVDIKFDGHSTQLKCLRPLKQNLNGRTASIESSGSKS